VVGFTTGSRGEILRENPRVKRRRKVKNNMDYKYPTQIMMENIS
jgi:hypothetical protein